MGLYQRSALCNIRIGVCLMFETAAENKFQRIYYEENLNV